MLGPLTASSQASDSTKISIETYAFLAEQAVIAKQVPSLELQLSECDIEASARKVAYEACEKELELCDLQVDILANELAKQKKEVSKQKRQKFIVGGAGVLGIGYLLLK